jgi:hypothetical protein
MDETKKEETAEVKLEMVKQFILENYSSQHGGYTEMRSEGNSTDVFADGESRGVAVTLKDIADIINLGLAPLVEQDDY